MVDNEKILEMDPKKNAKIKKALMKTGLFEKASYTPYIGDEYEDAEEKILFIGDCKLPVKNEFIKEGEKDIYPKANYCTQVVHYCKLIKDLDDVQDIKSLKEHLVPPENKRLTMESIRTLKNYAKNKSFNYGNFAYYNFFNDQFDNGSIPNQGLSSKSNELKQYQNKLLAVVEKLSPDKIVIESSVVKNKIIGRSRDSSFFKKNGISYEVADEDDVSAIDNYDESIAWINDELNEGFLSVVEEKRKDIYSFFLILNKIPVEKLNELDYNKKMELLKLTQFLHRFSTINVDSLSYGAMQKLVQCLCKFFFKKNIKRFNVEENKNGALFLLKKIIEEYFDIYMMKDLSMRKIYRFFRKKYFENLSDFEFQNELKKLIEEMDVLVSELENKSFKCKHYVSVLKAVADNCRKKDKSATGTVIQVFLKLFAREYFLNSKDIEPVVFSCMYVVQRFLYIEDVRKRCKYSKSKNEKDLYEFIEKNEDDETRKRIRLLIKKYPEIVGFDERTAFLEKKYFERSDEFDEKKMIGCYHCMANELNYDFLAQISNDEMTDLILFGKKMYLKYIDELSDQKIKKCVQIFIRNLYENIGELNYYKIDQLLKEMKKEFPEIVSNESKIKEKLYLDYKGNVQRIVDISSFAKEMKISVNAYSLFMCMKRMASMQYYAKKGIDYENIECMLRILEKDHYYIGKHLIPSALEYIKERLKDSIPYLDEKKISSDDINEYLENEGLKSASGIDNILKSAYKYFATNPKRRERKNAQIMTERIFENPDSSIRILIDKRLYEEFKKENKKIKNWTPRKI